MFHRSSELSNEGSLEGAGDLPRLFLTHLEGMDPSRQPSLGEVAEHVYSREGLLGQPARQEWERLAGSESPEAVFREAYQQYVTDGSALRQQYPERYDFLQQHIFSGREFHEQSRTEQIERGIESLWDMEALRPTVWERLSIEDRLSALQEVERRLAVVEGRPSVDVVAAALGPHTNGEYNFQQIRISAERLSGNDVAGLVETVAHEGRHCYQHYAIWYPWIHDDPAEVQDWQLNFQNYLSADLYGYELYRNQPVERDAWSFGEAIRKGLYGDDGEKR